MSLTLKRTLSFAGAVLLLSAPAIASTSTVAGNANASSVTPTEKAADHQAQEFNDLGKNLQAHHATNNRNMYRPGQKSGDPYGQSTVGPNTIDYDQGWNYAYINGCKVSLDEANDLINHMTPNANKRIAPYANPVKSSRYNLRTNTPETVNRTAPNADVNTKNARNNGKLVQTSESNTGESTGIIASILGMVSVMGLGVSKLRKHAE